MENNVKYHPLPSCRYPLKNLIPSSFTKAKVFTVELGTWMARGGKGKVDDGRGGLSSPVSQMSISSLHLVTTA